MIIINYFNYLLFYSIIMDMTAIDHAASSLKARIASHEWNDGNRMPSLNTLAVECNVSRMSLWKALGRLKAEGMISTRGKSIFCGMMPEPSVKSKKHIWKHLMERIGADILSHSFTNDILPPLNKLAPRYHAAINTTRKAVEGLREQGILDRTSRGYHIKRYFPGSSTSTIFLISQTAKTREHLFPDDPRTDQVIHTFERESTLSRFTGRLEGFDSCNAKSVLEMSGKVKETSSLAGIVINLWNPGLESHWQRWLDLLQMLVDHRVPVIALDQDGSLEFPIQLLRKENFKVLRVAGIRAGRMMAEYCISRGFRKPVFLASNSTATWVQKRYQGLKNQIDDFLNTSESVRLHAYNDPIDTAGLTFAAMGLEKSMIPELYRKHYSADEIRGLMAAFDKVDHRRIEKTFSSIPAIKTIRAYTKLTAKFLGNISDAGLFTTFYEALETAASIRAMQAVRQSFFQNVLAETNADIWVCSDDHTAFDALSNQNQQKSPSVRKIAIAGFDDWRESAGHGLTTYNFNMQGMVQQALHMIFDSRAMREKPAVSEVDGYVVERRTTRK
jgi:DNA-binding transcriptional regulator YhcF (GntR family)/DNA-binding LacI/PurR family transcriptional regulator